MKKTGSVTVQPDGFMGEAYVDITVSMPKELIGQTLEYSLEIGTPPSMECVKCQMVKPIDEFANADDCNDCFHLAEITRLQSELAKHQESEFHPDWSMLQATREALKECRGELAEARLIISGKTFVDVEKATAMECKIIADSKIPKSCRSHYDDAVSTTAERIADEIAEKYNL